jgi:hypothetical protein
MEQPIGYNKDLNLVCKLNKALYGLKQAARQWQIHLSNKLNKLGFIAISADNSIFVNKNRNIILATHIDDILVFSEKLEYINKLYKDLNQELDVSNLGEIKYYLGIEVFRNRSKKSIILTQKRFILNLLNRFNKLDLKPAKNPLVLGIKLEKNLEQATELDIKEYQKQIGSLIYLVTATRPDLAYPVGLLARFMSNPDSTHFKALDRIWQYLIYSKDYGLIYQFPSKSIDLLGYSDSDWGGDYSRKSTTGYLYLLGDLNIKTAISWNSKLQKTIALSSCEAEYMALKEAIKENLYIKSLIKQIPVLNSVINNTKTLYTDSNSAIDLAKNPVHHFRTKHIDIQYHFVRENYLNKVINLEYCPTEIQLADGLTKAISTEKYLDFIKELGLKRELS